MELIGAAAPARPGTDRARAGWVRRRCADLGALFALACRALAQRILHRRLGRQGSQVAPSALLLGGCRVSGPVTIAGGTIIMASVLDGRGGLTIGRHVVINHATIITAQHDVDSPAFETIHRPVHIEDYAVVFTGATVLPGTTIGAGAVIAAGAVVSGDVPPMAVVAGNPSRVVRQRTAVHSAADLRRMAGFAPRRLRDIARRWRSGGSGR